MKVLVVGGLGQLGRALTASAPSDAVVVSHDRDTLDITDRAALDALVVAERPDLIFNAAAYTAVDQAEAEEDAAYAINAAAVGYLAEAADRVGARLVQVSTDFVFDGAAGTPYVPGASPNPLNAYGRTKLAGEQAAGATALIVRTAWVYAPTGRNFVRTMLRLLAERPEVRVVADQIGTPTWAPGLAAAIWALAARDADGLHHYTDAGVASWYDFAVAIREEAVAAGILTRAAPVVPISTTDYPTPARRPPFSVLEKSGTYAALGVPAPHWRDNLRLMMQGIVADG